MSDPDRNVEVMEATATIPGQPGSTNGSRTAGEHIHHLLALAESLIRTATAKSRANLGTAGEPALLATPLGLELDALSDDEAAAWAQTLEHLNRHLQGLLVQAAGELSDRVGAGRYQESGARTPAEYLSSSLKLSRAEATHRLLLAQKFLPAYDSLTQIARPPSQVVLGSALFSGKISAGQALIVSGFVDRATALAAAGRIPQEASRELEETLAGYAEVEPPYFLQHLGVRAMALLDPDGQKPSEAQRLAKQGIFFRKPYKGWVRIDGYLTISQYERTMAYLGWATNPKRPDDQSQDTGRQHDSSERPIPTPRPPLQNPGQPLWTASTAEDGSTWRKPPPADRVAGVGQGWRPPLAPEDIPPRPPNAPANALPPVHEGDTWFWFPDITEQDNGWTAPPDDSPLPESESESEDHWWGGPAVPDAELGVPWPHHVDGVFVPEPGPGGELEDLSPIDPNSSDPAVKDRRTAAQKLLDGLIGCLKLAASTDKLPMNGGLKPQLYVSVTQEDLARKDHGGSVLTPYCGQVPLALFEEELCASEVTELFLDSNGSILDVGRTQRLFTFAQRKILVARDMGCAFPDCVAPPQWTEGHHIIPWKDGGVTSVDNGVLCCSLHHHYLHERGWTVRLEGSIAWFTPPYSEDITRRERQNTFHHSRF